MSKQPTAGTTRTLTLLAGLSSLAIPIQGAEIINADFTVAANSGFDAVSWSAYFTRNDTSVVDWSTEGIAPGFVTGGGDYIFFAPAGDINFDTANGPGLIFTSVPGTNDIATITSISFDENMDATPEDQATARFAIEIAGQWYASEFSVSSDTELGPGGAFATVTLSGIDFTDGANWRLLTVALGDAGTGEITLAGAPVGGTLSGMVNSVGVYSLPGNGGDHSRFDNYIVNNDAPEPPTPEPQEPFLEELFVNDDTIDQNAGSIDWTALVTENDEIVSYAQTGVGTATGIARGDYAFHAPKQDPEVANDPALITTSKAGTAGISTFISVEWDASGDNADHEFRVAIQIDGIWYASNPAQNDGVPDSGGTPDGFNPMSFAPESFASASNWLVIENAVIGDPDPLSLGAAPEADLTGTVTAYGMYVVPGVDDEIGGDHIRFDNFTIEVVQVVDVPTLMVEAVGSDLVFSWDSEEGKLYNLRSDTGLNGPSSEWPIYADHMEIVATPPMNMLTIPRPADPAHFFVIEEFDAPPEIALSDDFESGIGDWQVSSPGASGTDWQLGAPTTVGPTAANSGTNCFGTNISSEYAFGADVSLRSEPVNLTSAASATLSFSYYLDGDPNPGGDPFDTATVSILDSSDNVIEVVQVLGNEVTANWTPFTAAVPASALGQEIKVEFRFVSDGVMNAPGWYIDDVQVTVP